MTQENTTQNTQSQNTPQVENTQNIELKPVKTEVIRKLIEEAKEVEAKFILRLSVETRRGGCGYVYNFEEYVKPIYGRVEILVLDETESDCTLRQELLIIPKSVPAIVMLKHYDDDPSVGSYAEIFVFTDDGWKKVTSSIGYLLKQEEQEESS